MYNLIRRLMSTTTQQDVKKFDEVISKVMRYKIDINDKDLHEKFKKNLEEKRCKKCEEVRDIVKPKVTFRIEQD